MSLTDRFAITYNMILDSSYRRYINKISLHATIINMGRITSLVQVHKNRGSHAGIHTVNNEELIAYSKKAQCRIEKPIDFELIDFELIDFKDLANQKIDGFYLTIHDISRLQEIYKEISSNINTYQ